MPTPTGEYLHGSEPREQARLSLLNRLMNDACLRAVGVRRGERVLDVGSGLEDGFAALRAWSGLPGAALWYCVLLAEGVKE